MPCTKPIALPLCLLCMIAHSAPSVANDSAFVGDGATVYPINEARVRMLREDVTIRYQPDPAHPGRNWIADCQFVFRNLTDKRLDLQIGFPDWRVVYPEGGKPQWAIRAFAVTVAGKRLAVRHKRVKQRKKAKLRRPGYKGAYTFKVIFAPRATVKVRNVFRFGGLKSNEPNNCLAEHPAADKRDIFWKRSSKLSVAGMGPCDLVQYIVTSGLSWAGSIGQAYIRIEVPPDYRKQLYRLYPSPPASMVNRRWVEWRFRNWTPTGEIRLAADHGYPGILDVGQARTFVRHARRNNFHRQALGLVYRAHRAQHKEICLRRAKDEIFLGEGRKEKTLGPRCKALKAVLALLVAERNRSTPPSR